MYPKNRNKILLAALFLVTALPACTKIWDDHNQVTDPNLTSNLAQAIKLNASTGVFSSLLVKTGYDKIISSSKTYTVWAPTDQALLQLSPAILNDSTRLKLFVANHISNQAYLMGAASNGLRIQMLNGKYMVLTGNQFDSANVVTANQYASNGIFHVIDKFVPRYDNCWEFLNNSATVPLMKAYLLSLNHNVFDPAHASQTSVDPASGLPVYDSATGMVRKNYFLDSVMNVGDETSQYTLVLLQDNSYTSELNKLTPWFKTTTADSTNNLSSMFLVKDFAFKGLYTPAQLPDTLVSQYGVKVPLTKSNIVASYKTSNGLVYVMSQVNFTMAYKFPPVYIQGEKPTAFSADRTSNVLYRVRVNPLTTLSFYDIFMQNYNYANYAIRYKVFAINSMRYDAYWVAVNDVQATPLWTQRLAMDSTTNTTLLPAVTVAYQNYNEVALGQFNVTNYRPSVNFYVMGPTTASSTGGNNSISLDYIKLVPAF